jgi:LmbE family N-acetylglucosaminyl deacetylase
MRRRALPLEEALVPYHASLLPGARWLVLAPHPDDEVLGPGATLAAAAERGVEVRTIIVTDGAAQGEAMTRSAEARRAAGALGVPGPELWGFADRSLHPDDPSLLRALTTAFGEMRPDLVLVPAPVDLHPDHRALALAVHRLVRRRRRPSPVWIAAYEVAVPLLPNVLVSADAAWERKVAAAACYASQLAVRPYDRVMDALAVVHSLTLDGVRRAEAFHLLQARRLARLSPRRWAALMGSPAGVE